MKHPVKTLKVAKKWPRQNLLIRNLEACRELIRSTGRNGLSGTPVKDLNDLCRTDFDGKIVPEVIFQGGVL
jgi:hypothetical protein